MASTGSIPVRLLGPYTILSVLGEGGMGMVYKAEQKTPIHRFVALKVVKPGLNTREIITRFQSERRSLALMNHPNIAMVHDAGMTELGQPYFAMEYVEGLAITKFADQQKLTIRQRLELFLQVCEAISHAHKKLIIHRDIKASNVLAYLQDGKPAVKVIDFGIAKALSGEGAEDSTMQTVAGGVVGTYEYMSPEQAAGSPDIDTRTDVYSLGVLLYELLTGARPFDSKAMKKAGDQEIRRMIREDEPPRPSTRLSSLGSQAGKLTEARQMEVGSLVRQLRSELEWIPLKAMRKESSRRYESPMQLAEDIRNYLEKRPLIAGPETGSYRVRKFISKRKAPLTAAAAILIVLAGGVIGTSLGFVGQRRMRLAADALREQADHLREQADQRATEAEAARNEIARQKRVTENALAEAQKLRVEEAAARAEAMRKYEAIKQAEVAKKSVLASTAEKTEAMSQRDLAERLRDAEVAAQEDAVKQRQVIARENYFPDIIAAQEAIQAARMAEARDILEDCPVDQRNWEWCYLSSAFRDDASKERVLHQSTNVVERLIAFDSNGSHLLTRENRQLKLWDTATGKESSNALPEADVVALSPDGRRIAAFMQNAPSDVVRILDVFDGRMTTRIELGDGGKTAAIAFSPDGMHVATAPGYYPSQPRGRNGTSVVPIPAVRVWDIMHGAHATQLGAVPGRDEVEKDVTFSPDGARLATLSVNGVVRIIDTSTYLELGTLERAEHVIAVCFSSDGNQIGTIDSSNVAQIWDTNTLKDVLTLKGSDAPRNGIRYLGSAITFSPDGSRIICLNHIWDAKTGREIAAMPGEFFFSSDGRRLLQVSYSGRLIIKIIAKDLSSLKDAVIPVAKTPPTLRQPTPTRFPVKRAMVANSGAAAVPQLTGDAFICDYRGVNEPGDRYWKRIDQTHWQQTYPSGKTDLFEVIDQDPAGGAGIRLRCSTLQLEILIPPFMGGELKFRQAGDVAWRAMGPIRTTAPAANLVIRPIGDAFAYDYKGTDDPGPEYWQRIDGTHWQETSSSGKISLFEVMKPDPAEARSIHVCRLPDRRLELLIPPVIGGELKFHQGADATWHVLGLIRPTTIPPSTADSPAIGSDFSKLPKPSGTRELRVVTASATQPAESDANTWIDLLKLTNPTKLVWGPPWKATQIGPSLFEGDVSTLIVPIRIEGDYDLQVDLTRDDNGDPCITFPVAENFCTVALSHSYGKGAGLETIDGKTIGDRFKDKTDAWIVRPSPLKYYKVQTVLIQVRCAGDKTLINVKLNGTDLVGWEGDPIRLGVARHFEMPSPYRLGLGAWRKLDGYVTYRSARLQCVKGRVVELLQDNPSQ